MRQTSEDTYVECVFEIKIVMTIEMTANKFIDLCFGGSMKILELVHSLKFDDVQTIWKDAIWLSLQKML